MRETAVTKWPISAGIRGVCARRSSAARFRAFADTSRAWQQTGDGRTCQLGRGAARGTDSARGGREHMSRRHTSRALAPDVAAGPLPRRTLTACSRTDVGPTDSQTVSRRATARDCHQTWPPGPMPHRDRNSRGSCRRARSPTAGQCLEEPRLVPGTRHVRYQVSDVSCQALSEVSSRRRAQKPLPLVQWKRWNCRSAPTC